MILPARATTVIKLAFWASLACVVTLSLMPVEQLPDQVSRVWDKAQHAGGFAVLTALGLLAYPRSAWSVCTGLLLTGAGIELAQHAIGWRHGDIADLLADAVGILATAAVWMGIRRIKA